MGARRPLLIANAFITHPGTRIHLVLVRLRLQRAQFTTINRSAGAPADSYFVSPTRFLDRHRCAGCTLVVQRAQASHDDMHAKSSCSGQPTRGTSVCGSACYSRDRGMHESRSISVCYRAIGGLPVWSRLSIGVQQSAARTKYMSVCYCRKRPPQTTQLLLMTDDKQVVTSAAARVTAVTVERYIRT